MPAVIGAVEFILVLMMLVGKVHFKVYAFCAAEDDTLVICQNDRLLVIPADGAVKTVNLGNLGQNPPQSAAVSGSTVTLFGYGSQREYDLSTGTLGKEIMTGESSSEQDLNIPVRAGGSEYSYESSFGRFRFYETKPDGEVILRYEMPLFDHVMLICMIIETPLLFLSIVLCVVFSIKNENWDDRPSLWNMFKK